MWLAVAVLVGALLHTTLSLSDTPKAAYFMFEQKSPDMKIQHFVFALTDVGKISEARDIIAGKKPAKRAVQGTIVKQRTPYNPQWSFYLDPGSIGFFEMATEVCDANVTYVENHLSEVGGSMLPNNHWCPWSSRLIAEVTDQIDPASQRPVNPKN